MPENKEGLQFILDERLGLEAISIDPKKMLPSMRAVFSRIIHNSNEYTIYIYTESGKERRLSPQGIRHSRESGLATKLVNDLTRLVPYTKEVTISREPRQNI